MSSLVEKLKKNSKLELSDVLTDSTIFNRKEDIPTDVPMLNVALSGDLEHGFTRGTTVLAGPSKHYKSSLGLKMVSAYQKTYPESAILFYDSEFGSPLSYWRTFGIDTDRVVHCPIRNIEELKFDLMNQLSNLTKGEKVMIFIDSVGNLASKKEVEDALNEKSVADMTRAKAFKSLFRMVTPYFSLNDIPCVVVGHTYKTQDMYPKDVLSGGTGIMYSADTVLIIGRQQDKTEDGIQGYNFILNVDKSRFVREKSKIPIYVSFAKGIEKYSGLLEVAMKGGFVFKPSIGWYARKSDPSQRKFREDDTNTEEFWRDILSSEEFKTFLKSEYQLGFSAQKPAPE